jgi:hypothetical protein
VAAPESSRYVCHEACGHPIRYGRAGDWEADQFDADGGTVMVCKLCNEAWGLEPAFEHNHNMGELFEHGGRMSVNGEWCDVLGWNQAKFEVYYRRTGKMRDEVASGQG